MPAGAYRECRYPRCPNYQADNGNGYCEAHCRERTEARTYKGLNRGAGRFRWMRSAFLMRNPICAICKREPAGVLDHVTPHKGDVALYWDQSNWQGLCVLCHGRKTADESWPGRVSKPGATR